MVLERIYSVIDRFIFKNRQISIQNLIKLGIFTIPQALECAQYGRSISKMPPVFARFVFKHNYRQLPRLREFS